MLAHCYVLLCVLPLGQTADNVGSIRGVAINGTHNEAPLGQAEIVLRASQDGAFTVIASTTTDMAGQFSFTGLPADKATIYLPGVNRDGIHYPGPRIRLSQDQPMGEVKLMAFESVSSPSPLVCRHHELHVHPDAGFVEITETLVIENPTQTTYIGERVGDHPPVTLRVSVPEGLENVTFEKEFHGRNFQFTPGGLATQIPWLPGKQELKFIYRIPGDQRELLYRRPIDLATDQVLVNVTTDPASVTCNLPQVDLRDAGNAEFAHRGSALPKGYEIELRLGDRPVPWEVHARWAALIILPVLITISILAVCRRQHAAETRSRPSVSSPAHNNHASQRSRRSKRATSTSLRSAR